MKNPEAEALKILLSVLFGLFIYWALTPNQSMPCATIYPDTCAVCRYHIDTTKYNAMMMYINGDFVFRDEVEKAYEKRIEKIKKH